MTIDEAIEKLSDLTRYSYEPETELAHDALKLGTEALKRLKEARNWSPLFGLPLLPGEK